MNNGDTALSYGLTRTRDRLDELLRANRKLMTVYVLKNDLKHLWQQTDVHAAFNFWRQ